MSALTAFNDDILTRLFALTTYSNQVSLIYSFAAEPDRAEQIIRRTLALVKPYSLASAKMRLATASLHQNLARLALRTGEIDAVSEHIQKMRVGEGFGEDHIHANFIASCNAYNVATFGRDAPYFARHSSKCVSEYAETIRREAEAIFLMREKNWRQASCVATRNISLSWDCNIMWQLYSLLAEWFEYSAVRRADELHLILDEVELEEPRSGVGEISIVKLMLRVCSLAGLCSKSLFERALRVTEGIGARHGDFYMAHMSRLLGTAYSNDPFFVEIAYREALRFDAKQLGRNSTAYEQELLRMERAKLTS